MAQSLLEGANIPFFTKGENDRSLSPVFAWVELQVGTDDEADARSLLADLVQP